MELKSRKLYDVSAPNSSTGIINGKSSNVLNWDDTRFSWAYPKYKMMLGNFWTPMEIDMTADKKQWLSPLMSPTEQEAFKMIIGLLAFLDSIQTDYASKIAEYITDSSINALMIILAQQEVIHNHSYSYVLSSLVDRKEQEKIFEYWKTNEVLRERNDWIAKGYEDFINDKTPENFLKSIVYDVVLEGLFFYSGFAFFYNLARNEKMVATNTMISYINRDEQQHVGLFVNIFKEMLAENPELNTPELKQFVKDTFIKASELEINWGNYVIGNKFDGLNSNDLSNYIKFMASKRCNEMIGERPYEGYRENPMRWIKAFENTNDGKTDFFEQKSRQYTKVDKDNGFDDL